MRTFTALFLLALLAACGSSAAGGSGSSGTSGSGGSSGGPASGTATLTGASAFTVGTTFFRWGATADGGASRDSAQVMMSDVSATCAQVTDGLNRHFTTFTLLGIEPRLAGGLVTGTYSYSESTGDPANGMDLGWFSVTQGSPPLLFAYDSVSANLTAVSDDSLSGTFTITWAADGGSAPAPLQGTFTAPLCGPRP